MNIRGVRSNIAALKFFSFLDSLYPMSILAVVWFYQITGSYTLAAAMFSIQIVSQGIFEIPSGLVSDKLGRVVNLRVSAGLWLLSYLLMATSGVFGGTVLLIAASVIGGLAGAMYSGTIEALIFETLSDARKQDKFDIVFSRIGMVGQIAAMCGAGIAAATVYLLNLSALAWLTVGIGALFFASSFWLSEPATTIQSKASGTGLLLDSLRKIWRNKKLRAIFGIKMLGGDALYHLEGAYFATLIPAPLIPFARLFRQFTGAVGFYLAPLVRRFGFLRILTFSTFGSACFTAIGVAINGVATPFINSTTNLFYGLKMTASQSLMQSEFSPEQRATMGNIQSLLSSISSGLQLVLLGFIADTFSMRAALAATLVFSITMALCWWRLSKKYN